jgi:ABC-type phosphate transport system substrate-binding protein
MQRTRILLFVFMVAAQLPGVSTGPARLPMLALPAAASSDQSLAIVVNQSNPVENCSMEELRKIFMGERSHWPNGRRITVVMLDPALPERKTVLRDIYGMTEKELNSHFIQGVFAGTVLVAPKTMATPAEVRKFVFNVPGAIGYVRAAEVDNSVKVLRVDGRLPDDKDYRFRLQARGAKP